MNCDDLRTKILNSAVCRLCLSENCEKIYQIDDESCENQQNPRSLIEKFNISEVRQINFK